MEPYRWGQWDVYRKTEISEIGLAITGVNSILTREPVEQDDAVIHFRLF